MRLFVNHLTVIDCSILDPDRGLIGASWIVDLEIQGKLNPEGMVMDFGLVKRLARDAIEDVADHRLLAPSHFEGCTVKSDGNVCTITFNTRQGDRYEHRSPEAAICKVPNKICDIASVTPLLESAAMAACPDNVESVIVQLREEDIPGASYSYSHGLKRHDGDCQRIAHGHRSKIEIYIDGSRDQGWEQAWADCWNDIYLVSREDIITATEDSLTTSYSANQGNFSITLPRHRCDILDSDSTVELIAEHLAMKTSQKSKKPVMVRAFEGVNKGAIATADIG